MKSERWQQVERLYHSASGKEANERASFLERACAGDKELRREVESLLSFEDLAEHFIESPAVEIAAKMIADEQFKKVAVGEKFNQYRVISPVAAGGMGEVYLAEDTRLRRRVALKFLPAVLTKDKTHLRRFELEARSVAALSHPNVCTLYEVIETGDGRHCIVMEYVDGKTVRQLVANGPIKLDEALDIAVQIASALSAAHTAGIVHRDIKPENVMVRSDGYVKVLDFGLAKLAQTGSETTSSEDETRPIELKTSPGIVMGTVAYMSPEQARGLSVDIRTDIWSLGVVLYEMVAGKHPFHGPTPTDVIISIAEREPEPLSKSALEVIPLQRIVTKALAKDRTDRYQTAEDALVDLKRLKRDLDLESHLDHYGQSTSRLVHDDTAVIRHRLSKSRGMLLFAVMVLLGVGGFVWATWFRQSSKSPTVPATKIRTLAVLPMKNFSDDPSQEYFSDGMTETLIAGLAKVTALRVTSRTSVMQFKDSKKPVKEIARELGVDAVVEGSVQRFGDKIRVSVFLVDGQTDQQLWNGRYDRELRDVLTLQNEVAREVTQAIQIKLTPQEQSRLGQASATNAAAYDEFLRARFYLNRQTKADNETAIETLKRVVTTDPNFAAGWAELSQAYVWKLFLFAPGEKDLTEKASFAVQKALALDPDLAEAYLARGRLIWTRSNHFPHDKAIQEYRRALDLNPSLDEARHQLAVVLYHVGLLDEAHQELEKVLASDPSNNLARFRVGETLLFDGKYEEALTALRNIPVEVNPTMVGYTLALTLFDLGKKQEAAATVEKFARDYPEGRGLFLSLQAMLAASEGHQRLAEQKINSSINEGKEFGHFHHTAYDIACAYALMNKRDEAIKWLASAADDGFPCYALFVTDQNLDNLRKDPRFIAFMDNQKAQWELYKKLLT